MYGRRRIKLRHREVHKWLVIFSIITFAIGFFLTKSNAVENMPIIAMLFIFTIFLPLFYLLNEWDGWKRSLKLYAVLFTYSFLFESLRVVFPIPYENFNYSELLGPKLFNLVPIPAILSWASLLIGACAISAYFFREHTLKFIISTAALISLFNFVIGSPANIIGLWAGSNIEAWHLPFVLAPLLWFFYGLGGALIFTYIYKEDIKTIPIWISWGALLLVILWTGVALWAALPLPFLIGAVVSLFLERLIWDNT